MKRKNPFKVLRCLGLDALCERVAKSGNASIAAMMAWVVVVAAFGAYAGETTAEEARTAAGNWLQKNRNPMGTVLSAQPRESRTVRNARGGALFHLVELEGGGFIVASGNTKISPIVCFSGEGRIEEIEGGPLLDLLKGDMESQLPGGGVPNGALAAQRGMGDAEREWAELLAVDGGMRTLRSISSESSISDVRVSPLVKSKWDQSVWPSGQPVFNAQTPNGAVCGCVATAGAQIMRFWQYPSAPARTGWCSCSFNGQSIGVKINPEAYAWSQMPLTSADAYNLSSAQINAISRLTLEVGASVGMGYTTTSSGSSANTFNLSYAFTNIFGYASSKVFAPSARLTYPTVLSGDWQNAVLASLDAAMPVSASLKSSAGGHSVVIDGYGEHSGSVYLHFNMGWSGSYDIWYKVMSEKMSDYAFSQIAGFNYNIHKSTKGDVLSGRVITASGTPVSGATVTLEPSSGSKRTTTSNARGIWYFRIERAGTNYVSATKATMASDRSRIIMNKLGNDTVTVGNRWGVVLMVEEPPLEPVENPTFSPRTGGFSGSSVSVSISCATAGAQIRYTTNGAEPTESSALYSGAIAVSSSTTIRARAYKSGMKPSEVVEKHYEQNVFKGSSMLADAADSPSLSFSGNRVGCVIGQTATTYDGVDAILLKSYVESKGFMKFRRTPVLTLMVSGPGVLRFKSKSISGAFVGLPTVVCRVDGVEKVYEENGEWAAHVVAVTSYGSHSIVWEASNLQMYADSASESVSLIAIDEVEWEPGMVTRKTITYNLNGADSGMLSPSSVSAYPGEKITVPAGDGVSRKGYLFGGWNTEPNGLGTTVWKGGKFTVGEQSQTLYARWCKIVEIPFDYAAKGGSHTYDLTQYKNAPYHGVGTLPDWAGFYAFDSRGNMMIGNFNKVTFANGATIGISVEANESEFPRSFTWGILSEGIDFAPMFVCTQQGDRSHTLSAVSIEGPESLVAGASQSLRCIGLYRDGKSERLDSAAWSIQSGASYADVNGKTGLFTAKTVSSEKTVAVACEYAGFRAARQIAVLPSVALKDALPGTGGLTAQSAGGWFGQTKTVNEGTSSAWCGSCASGARWFEFIMSGDAKLTFDFKLSAGEGRVLRIYDGGKLVKSYASLAEDSPWMKAEYAPTDSLDRTIRVVYEAEDGSKAMSFDDECHVANLKLIGPDLSKSYVIAFAANGGGGAMPRQYCTRERVYALTANRFTVPAGKMRFAGWRCSNGRRYDDGMLIFNLAQPGETVTMTAVWE